MTGVEELPTELKLYLKVEAAKRNMSYEALLAEIRDGRNPIPPHISELIREVLKAKVRLEAADAE